jgi:hypothetical protein
MRPGSKNPDGFSGLAFGTETLTIAFATLNRVNNQTP